MAAPPQSNQSDNSMAVVWLIAAVFVFSAIIWIAFKKQIVGFYFAIKLWEINVISLFTNKLMNVKSLIETSNPNQLVFQDVVRVGEAVGDYLRYPVILLILIFAALIFFSSSTRVFKKTYNMKDLAECEKTNWPQITPVTRLDLAKANIDKGPWAMALTPMQFCKKNNLLQEYRRPPSENMTRKEWNKIEVMLKRGEANKIFAIQLGPLWPGINRVPPHVKALFAIFAARLNGDSKSAAELLAKINISSASKLDFSGGEELCKKHYDTKLVQQIVQSHAYLLTLMAELLEAARSDGVQASADFLWLKPVDRRLWYMLNTVGRQTPFVEVAGPFAHWIAEKEIGRKLIVPMVEEATNALGIALKEIVYKPDEEEEKEKEKEKE
ncbi:MAG TPA: type IVB secretion system coupling complex protein DotM/IcmP [Gammaproteobacteria bacterium]|nr:type IVB secretion system coupling complex protein DotM/IcmP [Gammaproteobacteria bacterium]